MPPCGDGADRDVRPQKRAGLEHGALTRPLQHSAQRHGEDLKARDEDDREHHERQPHGLVGREEFDLALRGPRDHHDLREQAAENRDGEQGLQEEHHYARHRSSIESCLSIFNRLVWRSCEGSWTVGSLHGCLRHWCAAAMVGHGCVRPRQPREHGDVARRGPHRAAVHRGGPPRGQGTGRGHGRGEARGRVPRADRVHRRGRSGGDVGAGVEVRVADARLRGARQPRREQPGGGQGGDAHGALQRDDSTTA